MLSSHRIIANYANIASDAFAMNAMPVRVSQTHHANAIANTPYKGVCDAMFAIWDIALKNEQWVGG